MSKKFGHKGEVVRELRKRKKLTLIQLADSIEGYDAGNLSRFETGTQGISDEKLEALAKVLGTTPASIMVALEKGIEHIDTLASADIPDNISTATDFDARYRAFFEGLSKTEQAKLLGKWEDILDSTERS